MNSSLLRSGRIGLGRASTIALAASLACLTACGSEDSKTPPEGIDDGQQALSPGVHITETEAIFQTSEYTLQPGEEKFLCFAANVDEDLTVDQYSHAGANFLHHVVFARTLAPEPDGLTECDVLFRLTWEPMYLAGAGASKLEFPEGAAHQITKGTQLLSQLHLLNAADEPQTGSLAVHMHRSLVTNPKPVSGYVFGNFDVNLAPRQSGKVEANCTVPEAVELFAAFPHMHTMGTGLTFEVGQPGGGMKEMYSRTPYSFDDQHLDPFKISIAPGTPTHLTCRYENPSENAITFGESTKNEMCFLLGFAIDRPKIGGCLLGTLPSL